MLEPIEGIRNKLNRENITTGTDITEEVRRLIKYCIDNRVSLKNTIPKTNNKKEWVDRTIERTHAIQSYHYFSTVARLEGRSFGSWRNEIETMIGNRDHKSYIFAPKVKIDEPELEDENVQVLPVATRPLEIYVHTTEDGSVLTSSSPIVSTVKSTPVA